MTPTHSLLLSAAASAALIATAAIAQPVGGTKIRTVLTGAAEVPGPGDGDGRGTAVIQINPGKAQICWNIEVRDIEPATAAHIHSAPAGIAGPVVVGLSPPTDGDSDGCELADRSLLDAIRKSPQGYYVNVHNATYPNGAIRGQLG